MRRYIHLLGMYITEGGKAGRLDPHHSRRVLYLVIKSSLHEHIESCVCRYDHLLGMYVTEGGT